VSGNIIGKTETATTRVEELTQNFQTSGAFAVSLVLATIAVLVLVAMTVIRPREGAHS
jgi:ABC-type sulfate transport system permease subunit